MKLTKCAFLSASGVLLGGCCSSAIILPETPEPQSRDFINYGEKVEVVDVYAGAQIEKTELISGGGYLPIFSTETNGTPGNLGMYQVNIDSGGGVAAHKTAVPVTLYVVSGSGELKIDDKMFVIQHGSALYLPKDVTASLINNGKSRLVALFITVPPFGSEKIDIIAPPPEVEPSASSSALNNKLEDQMILQDSVKTENTKK